jgi:hypothetical protein
MIVRWQAGLVRYEVLPLISYLVNNVGIDINAQDVTGKTALMHFALGQNLSNRISRDIFMEFMIENLKELESLGANFALWDLEGRTVFNLNMSLIATYESIYSNRTSSGDVGAKRKRK